MALDRRTFLQLLSTSALSASFPSSIARALEIPAHHRTGTINDVEHIVFMMQENRSFDHYFGTLRGVRGFGDPHPVTLSTGNPVWYQPSGSGYVLPFHPGAPNLGLQFLQDLAHDWDTTHAAWNNGHNDQWVPQKGTTTMAHLNRSDIPYHYALADAFTVCDAYFSSLLGPTDPNRYHMWTGCVGNDGKNGSPVIDNAEAGYDWSTYPERLEKAGVSWKIYQDAGEGLDASGSWGWTGDNAYIGNYGDNSLLYFHQYQNAPQGSPLAEKARTGTNALGGQSLFEIFQNDVKSGNLPQVSWVVAPEAYTEHPNWPANYGAWYVSQILDALTANPEVWSKTVFILMYDENDGFFDHVVPPTPPQTSAQGKSTVSIANEIFPGNAENPAGPYGLGMRVPMVIISPWSKGGYVSSEVFDHTSLIRFVEKRFGNQFHGLNEPNITKWRRSVSGDLTSAFNFKSPNSASIPLPSTAAYQPPDNKRHDDYVPAPPTEQSLPVQEPGTRPARAVPYELNLLAFADLARETVQLTFLNSGNATAVFHVRSNIQTNSPQGPWTYTVEPGHSVQDTWNLKDSNESIYNLSVYGPNGFVRSLKGSISGRQKADLDVISIYNPRSNRINLQIANRGVAGDITITDAYTGETTRHELRLGHVISQSYDRHSTHGWYDIIIQSVADSSFERRLAGHIETGEDSMTDPAIAALHNYSNLETQKSLVEA
jgi:phospholipase C